MKKILYVLGSRPTGGVGSLVYNYQKNFNRENINIDYILFSDDKNGEFDEKVRLLGSNIYVFPALKYSRVLILYNKLKQFFKYNANKYTAIHIHSPNISFLCYKNSLKYGIKNYIVHSHSIKYSDKLLNSIRNYFLCLSIRCGSKIYFACSKDAGKFLYGRKAIESKRVYIMNNAIDCEKFKYNNKTRIEIRKELGIKDELIIGNVGRFSKEKNHDFLINIFLELKKQNPNSKLLLVGDGPLMQNIKNKVKALELCESVVFLGRRNDINKILHAIDIFVMPSVFEGFGISLLEAQATGLLVFASDRIPKEVKVTENIHFLNILDSHKLWANEIIKKSKFFIREDQSDKVRLSGFDIKDEAIKLEKYYTRLK